MKLMQFPALLALSGLVQAAPVQSAALATPPPAAQHFLIQSTGAHHGDSWLWTTSSGVRWGRETLDLRGQLFDMDSQAVAGVDGTPEQGYQGQFLVQGPPPSPAPKSRKRRRP